MIASNSKQYVDELQKNSKIISNEQISYYYPSEKIQSCFWRPSFKSRFPLAEEANNTCFCIKCCNFCCYMISHKKVNVPEDQNQLQRLLPIKRPIFSIFQDKITYTWIGHSTAVISIGKHANIMIDPIFSERSSPIQCVGPKRYRAPACNIDELPPIHAVLVSHDHYDHLDDYSLHQLQKIHEPIFIAGLNSSDAFPQGCNLYEMDWTEQKEIKINDQLFKIIFFPVCHWAKRTAFQKNTRLWGGFIIITPKGQKIFYSGDTAYCSIFKQIGHKFGPFDLSVIPIGAYLPRSIMQNAHIDPQEAVLIHIEIKSKKSVGVHWGTLPLGFEHYYQPKEDLQKAVKKYRLTQDEFITIHHGSQFSVDYR